MQRDEAYLLDMLLSARDARSVVEHLTPERKEDYDYLQILFCVQ